MLVSDQGCRCDVGEPMQNTVPIGMIIPTYNRGMAVLSVLERIQECDPKPAEIWIHIDLGDGVLERELSRRFPKVGILTSPTRMGPGGGRHQCLLACTTPYAVSFDDDSYPVDFDFFSRVERLFSQHSRAAIIGAGIWHRHEPVKVRTDCFVPRPSYIGCGYAIRLSAYRQVRGYLARPVAYGMEESDLSLQLLSAGWQIFEAGDLRVFHDTDLHHRESPETTSATITNVGLCAFLNFPVFAWAWGSMQVAKIVLCCILKGQIRGIGSGLLHIPIDCYRNRRFRKPMSWRTLRDIRRGGAAGSQLEWNARHSGRDHAI
jgi:GT2 family glycosyltransferase